jgi:sec-independent protein translocase protein TatB
VIALVAVIVLGPDRLPELARQAAQLIHRVRGMATNARDELRTELGPEYADLQLRDLDPRAIVRKHITEAMADVDREQAQAFQDDKLPEGQVPPYDVEAT